MKKIILYTSHNCVPCEMEKRFLDQKGIRYVTKNVSEDPAALQELKSLGGRVTPSTLIDGQLVMGFDQKKIEQLLGLKGSS